MNRPTNIAIRAVTVLFLLCIPILLGPTFSLLAEDAGEIGDRPPANETDATESKDPNTGILSDKDATELLKLRALRDEIETETASIENSVRHILVRLAAERFRKEPSKAVIEILLAKLCFFKERSEALLTERKEDLKYLNSLLRFDDISKGLPQYGIWRRQPALGDVNGDGLLDLAASGKGMPPPYGGFNVWLFDGKDGWILSKKGLASGSAGAGCRYGDVNKDGLLDVVFGPHTGVPMVYLGDGNGGWKFSSRGLVSFPEKDGDRRVGPQHSLRKLLSTLPDITAPSVRKGKGGSVTVDDAIFADMNGDGNLDVVTVQGNIGMGENDTGFFIFLGDGKGNWKFWPTRGLATHGGAIHLDAADLNNDGHMDIFCALNGWSDSNRDLQAPVWFGDGKGNFKPAALGARYLVSQNGNSRYSDTGDFNNDGNPDLIFSVPGQGITTKSSLTLLAFKGNGAGLWTLSSEGLSASPHSGVQFSDFNNDGNLDIVTTLIGGGVEFFLGDGTGKWRQTLPEGMKKFKDETGNGVATGDINGDGFDDFVCEYSPSGKGMLRILLAPATMRYVGPGSLQAFLSRPIGHEIAARLKKLISQADKALGKRSPT